MQNLKVNKLSGTIKISSEKTITTNNVISYSVPVKKIIYWCNYNIPVFFLYCTIVHPDLFMGYGLTKC